MVKSCILLTIGWGLFFIGQMKKYRTDKRVLWCMVLFMILTYAGCNSGADVQNYIYRYENRVYGLAPGFDLLMRLFKTLGFSFVAFKLVLAVVYMFFLYKAVAKCTANITMVLGLIWAFPFPGAITQLRNGLAAVIVLYGLVCYLKDPGHSTVKYIFWVLVGSMIHPAMLVYLVFVFAKLGAKWKLSVKVFLVAVAAVFVYLCVSRNLLYNIASRFISNPRYLQYFNFAGDVSAEELNWKGKLLPMVGQAMGYVGFHVVYLRLKKGLKGCARENIPLGKGFFREWQLDMIQFIVLMLFVLFPLYLRSPTYFRMYKNMIPLIHLVTAQYLTFSKDTGFAWEQANDRHKYIVFCTILAQLAVMYANDGSFLMAYADFSLF